MINIGNLNIAGKILHDRLYEKAVNDPSLALCTFCFWIIFSLANRFFKDKILFSF